MMMSESRSSSMSHDLFNQNIHNQLINELFEDNLPANSSNYNQLYDCIKNWLSMADLANMDYMRSESFSGNPIK